MKNNYFLKRNQNQTNNFMQNRKYFKDVNFDKKKETLNVNNLEVFPELSKQVKDKVKTNESNIKFKDILTNNVVENNVKTDIPIRSGWVRLTGVKGKRTIVEYGPPTIREIKENNPNYIMFNAIDNMKKKWEHYEHDYNFINGENSYADKFRLSPLYNSDDLETESDEDSFTNDKDNNEYDDFIDLNKYDK